MMIMKRNLMMNQRGATAVEFAIVLPLLLLILFGIIEFSVIMYDKAMITHASREGARAGIVFRWPNRVADAEIQNVVTTFLQNHLINFGGNSNATITTNGAQGPSGSPLTVTVNYRYDYLVLPSFANSLGGGLNLSAQSIMRME